MNCLIFFILWWSLYSWIALKTGSVMSELAILLDRVLCISKFSTSLLKWVLKISASSSLLLIMDSLWKAFTEKRGPTVFQNFLLSVWFYSLVSPKKRPLILRSKLTQKFIWRLKCLLDSSFLVFKNLFLSFDLFIIVFLSSLVIKLQFSNVYILEHL